MDEHIVGLPEMENKFASSDEKCRGVCGLMRAGMGETRKNSGCIPRNDEHAVQQGNTKY